MSNTLGKEMEEQLVGKSRNEVEKYLKDNDIRYRYVNIDMMPMVVTCDFRPERVNLSVNEGKVTNISYG